MLPEKDEHQMLHELMLENQRLLAENNQLLRKIRKASVWSFWLRVVWTLIILGAPFLIYYYLLEPYFEAFGSSIEIFQNGLQEVPGWKQFYNNEG